MFGLFCRRKCNSCSVIRSEVLQLIIAHDFLFCQGTKFSFRKLFITPEVVRSEMPVASRQRNTAINKGYTCYLVECKISETFEQIILYSLFFENSSKRTLTQLRFFYQGEIQTIGAMKIRSQLPMEHSRSVYITK